MQMSQNANVTKSNWDKVQIGQRENETHAIITYVQIRQYASITWCKWKEDKL